MAAAGCRSLAKRQLLAAGWRIARAAIAATAMLLCNNFNSYQIDLLSHAHEMTRVVS
jgi:hypothetical protein